MAVLLKLPHLVNKYGVPDMQVWRRRIEAGFDDKRAAELQFGFKTIFRQHFIRATHKFLHLLFNFRHDLRVASH